MPEEDVDVDGHRRNVLRATGAGIVGLSWFATAGRGESREQDASASVTFEEQRSDGGSVVVARVSTSVDGKLLVTDDAAGENVVYGETELSAGTDEEAFEVSLSTNIQQSGTVRALVFADDDILARDSAYVGVDVDSTAEFGVQYVEADSDAGFNYPYYLFVPAGGSDFENPPILVEPNNTGTATNDFEKHRSRAKDTVNGGQSRKLSEELGVPLLVPVFPRPRSEPVDWRHYTHQLDTETMHIEDGPLERIDRQVLQMVEDAKQRLSDDSYSPHEKIIMNGFSASGNFVNRFAALHPEEVLSVTAGGVNGMAVLPVEEAGGHTLNYQIGIADVEEITGEPFDREAFADVNQFIYMGQLDGNDTILYGDAWSDEQREIALDVYGVDMQRDRLPYCQTVYEEIGASAAFKIYEGAGHSPRPAASDIAEFHRRSIEGEDVSEFGEDLGSGGGEGADPEAAFEFEPSRPEAGEEVVFDASEAVAPRGELLSYTWDFDDGETAAGPQVQHTYAEEGYYSVALTVVDDDGKVDEVRNVANVDSADEQTTTGTETTSRATETESNSESTTADDEDASAASAPGFGIPSAVAGTSAAAYLLKDQVTDD